MNRTLRILIFVCCAAASLTAQNTACDGVRFAEPVFQTVKRTTVQYATAPNYSGLPPAAPASVILQMDVYEPQGDQAVARPVVVLAHGGSFVFGDRADIQADCERFARSGYVAASIQYRLYPVLFFGFPDSTDIIDAVTKAIGDMKAAVRYFREDASNNNLFRADTAHIFVGGYSAGAVTALHVGYIDEQDEVSSFVQNALEANGGIDGNSGTTTNQTYSSRVTAVFNQSGGLYRSHWIDAGEVPMVSIHGTADDVVYFNSGLANNIAYLEGSNLMHARALEVGVDSYLEVVQGGGHTNTYTSAQYAAQRNNFWTVALGTFENLVCGTTGTAEAPTDDRIILTPNPAHDRVQVTLPEGVAQAEVRLYDANGRLMQRVAAFAAGESIDLSNLPTGQYFLKINDLVNPTRAFKPQVLVRQ
jgi:para-nitrobenzyl esterase